MVGEPSMVIFPVIVVVTLGYAVMKWARSYQRAGAGRIWMAAGFLSMYLVLALAFSPVWAVLPSLGFISAMLIGVVLNHRIEPEGSPRRLRW